MLLTNLFGEPSQGSQRAELGNDLFQVRMGRLELPQCCHHRYLKPARLPIPPHPRGRPTGRLERVHHHPSNRPQTGFYWELPVPAEGDQTLQIRCLTATAHPKSLSTTGFFGTQ